MTFLRRLAHWIFGEYEFYRIYVLDLAPGEDQPPPGVSLGRIDSADVMERSPDPKLRSHTIYAGPESYGFGAWIGEELVGVSWYWGRERYARQRNFWPLADGEIKWIQITVSDRHQGRGLGRALTLYAQHQIAALGYRRAYARVWHSNKPSYRMVEAAGWRLAAWVLTARPLGKPVRLALRKGNPPKSHTI